MINPELRRQLWLNWRPTQLLWSALLVALVMALPAAMSPPDSRSVAMYMTATIGLWVAVLLFGPALASKSLRDEVAQRTWDWQRLSAITPWPMAWGKLLGSTLPAWLFAAWFAAVLVVLTQLDPSLRGYATPQVLLALLCGLALQAWAMAAELMTWHRAPAASRIHGLVVLALLPIGGTLAGALSTDSSGDQHSFWGWSLPGHLWLTVLALIGLALGLLALWRLMCEQLDVPTLPWAWPLGLCVAGFTLAGISPRASLPFALAITACLALLGTGLMLLRTLSTGLADWRQTQHRVSLGHRRQALQRLPLWPVSWLLAALCTALAMGLGMPDVMAAAAEHQELPLSLLWVLRDAGIATALALVVGRVKSPLGVFVTVWVVLNVLLPLIVTTITPTAAAWLNPWAGQFNRPTGPLWLNWLALGVQAALVWAFVARLFTTRVRAFARPQA